MGPEGRDGRGGKGGEGREKKVPKVTPSKKILDPPLVYTKGWPENFGGHPHYVPAGNRTRDLLITSPTP